MAPKSSKKRGAADAFAAAAPAAASAAASQRSPPVTVPAHLQRELSCAAPPAALLRALQDAHCRPLDADAEQQLRDKADASDKSGSHDPSATAGSARRS